MLLRAALPKVYQWPSRSLGLTKVQQVSLFCSDVRSRLKHCRHSLSSSESLHGKKFLDTVGMGNEVFNYTSVVFCHQELNFNGKLIHKVYYAFSYLREDSFLPPQLVQDFFPLNTEITSFLFKWHQLHLVDLAPCGSLTITSLQQTCLKTRSRINKNFSCLSYFPGNFC